MNGNNGQFKHWSKEQCNKLKVESIYDCIGKFKFAEYQEDEEY